MRDSGGGGGGDPSFAAQSPNFTIFLLSLMWRSVEVHFEGVRLIFKGILEDTDVGKCLMPCYSILV